MNKKVASYLYFITGILFAITAVINFADKRTMLGITYICLTVIFILIGAAYRKRKG